MHPGKLYQLTGNDIILYRLKTDGTIITKTRPRSFKEKLKKQPLLLIRILETSPASIACEFLVGDTIMRTQSFSPMHVAHFFKRIGNDI